MAITNMDGVAAGLAAMQNWNVNKASITSVAAAYVSHWGTAGFPTAGAISIGNTTTGIVPTSSTLGGIPFTNPTGGPLSYLGRFDIDADAGTGSVILYDRLFHVGSINLNSLATTTLSSIPSYSARVDSNYAETEIWLEMDVACSATATTVTVGYTNQNGTTGHSTASSGSISGFIANRMLPLALQSGDTGVQAVTSVTVGGTVATAGSVNIVVLRRLASQSVLVAGLGSQPKSDPISMGMRQIYDSSCLALMESTTTTSTGLLLATIGIIQG